MDLFKIRKDAEMEKVLGDSVESGIDSGEARLPQLRPISVKPRNAVGATLGTLIYTLLLVLAATVCIREAGQTLRIRGGPAGRKLATQEDEEVNGAFSGVILGECLSLQAVPYHPEEEMALFAYERDLLDKLSATKELEQQEDSASSSTYDSFQTPHVHDIAPSFDSELDDLALQNLLGGTSSDHVMPAELTETLDPVNDFASWSPSQLLGTLDLIAADLAEQRPDKQVGTAVAQQAGVKRTSYEAGLGSPRETGEQKRRSVESNSDQAQQELSPERDSRPSPNDLPTEEVDGQSLVQPVSSNPTTTFANAGITEQEDSLSSPQLFLNLSVPSPSAIREALAPADDLFFKRRDCSLPGTSPPGAPDSHLLYRLPVVEPKQLSRRFDVSFAVEEHKFSFPAIRSLRHMRALLAEPRLSQSQAAELLADSEQVANYLLTVHAKPIPRGTVFQVVNTLGTRYLYLEGLFCTVQLLGPAMGAERWWIDFLAKIPVGYRARYLKADKRSRHLLDVCRRLHTSVTMLKQGRRPPPTFTITLKQDLLFHKDIPAYFKSSKWDDWRVEEGNEGDGLSTVSL
ncbi:hypothetical protein Efla_002551 [Eimeria flavescens]